MDKRSMIHTAGNTSLLNTQEHFVHHDVGITLRNQAQLWPHNTIENRIALGQLQTARG